MNWSVVPLAIEAAAAVMLIDCKAAALTVSAMVFEVTPFWVAEMLLDPIPTPVASPAEVMLALPEFDDVQVAELVKF